MQRGERRRAGEGLEELDDGELRLLQSRALVSSLVLELDHLPLEPVAAFGRVVDGSLEVGAQARDPLFELLARQHDVEHGLGHGVLAVGAVDDPAWWEKNGGYKIML